MIVYSSKLIMKSLIFLSLIFLCLTRRISSSSWHSLPFVAMGMTPITPTISPFILPKNCESDGKHDGIVADDYSMEAKQRRTTQAFTKTDYLMDYLMDYLIDINGCNNLLITSRRLDNIVLVMQTVTTFLPLAS